MTLQEQPIDLNVIRHKPITELRKLNPIILQRLIRQVDDDLQRAKGLKEFLHDILVEKYKEQAATLRQQTGKDTGIVRLEDQGFTVVCDIPKKVEWDQEKLSRVIEKLTAEGWQRQQLAKVELKVSERTFNELPSGVRAQFEDARTISYGKPSYKFAVEDKEGAE